ncbi:NSFL1 cofactor p47 isoform X2 [Pararge aegeria]|uniref:NSFL1 cofactor p47 isoform X2 n=1 Tax=Pararge aegeria TaxID=116150 RepID=UPI0019D17323|nr:NSFL1 cofactor p47 isoform X2 [Pararge aegeria]
MDVTEILNEEHFQAEIAKAGTKLVIVDFYATWCPPCQSIAPFFAKLPAKFPQAVYLKVDIDKCEETARNQHINVMPSFIFFRNGSNNSVTVSGSKMPPNKEDILRQFCDVTGADDNRSKFFLESSNWQLDVALSSFYEHGSNMEEANTQPSSALPQLSDSDMESPPQSPGPPQKKDKKKSANPQFATLASLQQDSSSDEEGEAFYAGGSERSGQQILGPPGKGRKDIISEMFKSIRERGAVAFDEETSSTSRGRGGVFGGVGYRLGQTSDDHEQVTPGRQGGQQDNQPRSVRLQLYREGFSVDGGALRQYSDPDNAEFLNCIRRGEIPAELSGRGEVRLSLEDKRHDDCAHAAAPRHQAFSGKGHLLGSPTPATVGATVAVASSSDDRAANQRAAQAAVALDESSPLTTVQFRLVDGSRLTGRFNHTHTVADLIQYVSRAEPIYQLQPFTLLTSFPSSELTDRAATLAQANLLNTTLLQRLK